MPAALLMATVRAAIRSVAPEHPPDLAIYHVDQALHLDLERSDSYATLFLGQLDLATRRLAFVDAGHGHVFLCRANGRIETLNPRGLPLGIYMRESFTLYEPGEVVFEHGDTLILYSDGLATASGELFSPRDLVRQLDGAENTQQMLDRLTDLAPPYTEQSDDLTILILHCKKI
jgi:serine phosphatase RsbU (regulator of sigma subunit)